MPILIRGGTLINQDHSRRADVMVEGATIAAIGAKLDPPAGAELIDAGGCYVMPGGIDPKQLSRIDYNVFEGYRCTGAPIATLSCGRVAWLEGDLRAETGDGHYVERPAFSPVANSTWKAQTAPKAAQRAEVTP